MVEGMDNRYSLKPLYEMGQWANGQMDVIKRMYHNGVAYSLDFELATRTYHAYQLQYDKDGKPTQWKLLEHNETPASVLAALAERKMGIV